MPPARPLLRTLRSLPSYRTHTTASPSSVDPTEVHHFNALASSWWDPHGPSRLLHLMNPSRHAFLTSCLNSSVPISSISESRRLNILDVGCGGGIFAESAARLPWVRNVTGIDPSAKVLEIAKDHMRLDPALAPSSSELRSQPKLQYVQTSIDELSSNPAALPQGYDVITLFEVVEHVSSPASFLRSVMSHVKPGGWIIGSTIARTMTSWVVTKLVAEDLLRIVPRGTHDWKRYVNEEEMREWFAKQGWKQFRSTGVVYFPGVGWREVSGAEGIGNYYFGIRRNADGEA